MNILKTNASDGNYAKLAINKSILKEYRTSDCTRTVYLNDGDEFQIQLFNPLTVEIAAEIFIDNEPLSNLIILNPGERMWLERYTDKAKKFRFRTYTVDGDSKEVEAAISHNGEIKIKFYKKKVNEPVHIYNNNIYVHDNTYWWKWEPMWYNNITCNSEANSIKSPVNMTLYSSSISSLTGDCGQSVPTAASALNISVGDAINCSANIGGHDFEDGSSIAWSSTSTDDYIEVDNNMIETGRVSEGGNSNQKFISVDIDLESFPFRTEEFKILPYSRKPYTVNDAKKIYCSNCGHKLNTKFKFCPYCGEKID